MNKQKKILLVEDEESIREMIRCVLELEGYAVLTATDGKKGIDLLRSTESFCLILLDLTMPIVNGWDFLALLKADAAAANIPIVVISAEYSFNKVECSPAAFVQKPIRLNTLLSTISRHCA
ncbi:MAG: response regulator [Bdellovibrionota bacterium]